MTEAQPTVTPILVPAPLSREFGTMEARCWPWLEPSFECKP
jgi:hypothetical protein